MAGFPKEISTLRPVSIAAGFSRCMQVALSVLMANGIGILPYLDDWLLTGYSVSPPSSKSFETC